MTEEGAWSKFDRVRHALAMRDISFLNSYGRKICLGTLRTASVTDRQDWDYELQPKKSGSRLPRYVLPGQPQHIIQRVNNRQVLFASDSDFQFFRDAMVKAADQQGLAIHAYVWMGNHIHLLATP